MRSALLSKWKREYANWATARLRADNNEENKGSDNKEGVAARGAAVIMNRKTPLNNEEHGLMRRSLFQETLFLAFRRPSEAQAQTPKTNTATQNKSSSRWGQRGWSRVIYQRQKRSAGLSTTDHEVAFPLCDDGMMEVAR